MAGSDEWGIWAIAEVNAKLKMNAPITKRRVSRNKEVITIGLPHDRNNAPALDARVDKRITIAAEFLLATYLLVGNWLSFGEILVLNFG
jgi:hypothetical protein